MTNENPYKFGTVENTIYWAFTQTEHPISWIIKHASDKHGITQAKCRITLDYLFTEEEIIERQKNNSLKHGFDPRKLPSKNSEKFKRAIVGTKKLDDEYKKTVE